MSDAFWGAFIPGFVVIIVAVINYMKSQQNGSDIAQVSAKAESVDTKLALVATKQDKQHEEINGKLAEKDRLTIAAKIAEGILEGRKQLQAELDAKAIAVAEGMRAAQTAAAQTAAIQPPVTYQSPAQVQLRATNVPNVPAVLEGIAGAVVTEIGKVSAENKKGPVKDQSPVTLPPSPPQPLH